MAAAMAFAAGFVFKKFHLRPAVGAGYVKNIAGPPKSRVLTGAHGN
jgi:hypothetical protein